MSARLWSSGGAAAHLPYRGKRANGVSFLGAITLSRHHAQTAGGTAAVQSLCAAVAAGGTDQLHSQDPALDSLIDRWLSHKHASTSAPGQTGRNGSSSRRQQLQQQQSLQQDWEGLLGPVSVTMTSLATLEEGDDVFALSDSLGHLGGSLQELQQLTSQLLQQQQQQQDPGAVPAATEVPNVAQYTEQLSQLLLTASQQAAALDDSGLLNLLGISTVLLSTVKHSMGTSSSSMEASVQAAATDAVQAACAELWQRPRVAGALDAVQLTSLAVILRSLGKLGISSSALPVSLPLSAYRQLGLLADAGQLSGAQLAVCCWCLSSLPTPPPADAVTAVLHAAASAASSSSSGMDGLTLRRMLAACMNWRPYLSAQLMRGDGPAGPGVAAAAFEWMQSAARAFLWLETPSSKGISARPTTNTTNSSSSSSSGGLWKVAASIAHTSAAFGVFPGDAFTQAVANKLLLQPAAAAAAVDAESAATSSRELQEAAAAAGALFTWWGSLPAEQQQQLPQTIMQQQDEQQQQVVVQSFLSGVEHSCSSVAGSIGANAMRQLHMQLDSIAEHVLHSSGCKSACVPLLRAMAACQFRSQQLLVLCAAVSQQGSSAAADAAATLCSLKPLGWQQQLQQLLPALTGASSTSSNSSGLEQLTLGAAMKLHAAAAQAAAESPAASGLAAAVLQQLLQPSVLVKASSKESAALLVLLTVGEAPWKVTAGQRLQAAAPAGFAQMSGSSSSTDGVSAAVLMQQQCLRCMGVLVREGGQSLLPDQLVPVLAALRYLQQTQQQQQQQQQQWLGAMTGQVLSAYKLLRKEALAAVSLQLTDSAGLLAPRDIAWSARLLALLQARPSLALAAVVQVAAGLVGQMQQHDLVWMLWGLTKLRFTGERRLQQQLLSAALKAAAVTGDDTDMQNEQDWADAAATVDESILSSNSSAGQVDLGVALLWVAASRSCQEPSVLQLLSQITQHPEALRPAQVASVVWSFTRLAQQGLLNQQQLLQQRPQVVQLAERCLGSSNAGQELAPRSIAVLAWGLHRLGHKPSISATAALVAGALQHTLQNSSIIVAFLPGEFSCFLYCLAGWGVQLQQEQLQQLEDYLQQQLLLAVQAAAAAAAGSASAPTSDSSSSRSSAQAQWDGPAVCSTCWALSVLGLPLQHSTLKLAEQHVIQLIPESTSTQFDPAAPAAASNGSTEQQQRRQQQPVPPAASDLVLFGTACRAASYQPLQLLQQFRGWVLMQLADRGSNGLLALQSRGQRGANLAAVHAADAAAAAVLGPVHQRLTSRRHQHAFILSSVLLFLRQTGYADPALLQQLEVASVEQPVVEQLQWWNMKGRQLVMILSSFCKLGYVPQSWLTPAGVRCIMRHVIGSRQQSSSSTQSSGAGAGAAAGATSRNSSSNSSSSLSGQDCVELMECLAVWHEHPGLRDNTAVRMYILPGLAQVLMGVQHQLKMPPPAAAAATGQQGLGDTPPSNSNSSAGSTASNPTGSTGMNLVACMPGLHVVSLLRNMVHLRLPQSGKLFQKLQQQLLRRVEQVWPEFGPAGHVAAAHAAGRSGFDFSGLLKVQELLPQPQQEIEDWHFSTPSAASRLLWVFGNVGRHPGPQLLTAALTRVADAASTAVEVGMPLPLREVSTALYAVTVLQEQQHPVAVALVQLLQQAAEEGELLSHLQFPHQAEQLAACLLAAQDAAQAGGAPPPAPIASFDAEQGAAALAAAVAGAGTQGSGAQSAATAASRVAAVAARNSPWLALPTAVQQRLLEAWRRKLLRKLGKAQGMGEHMQLVMSLRQLGLRGRAKALSDDAAVCIDVAIATPSGERIAVELLGSHNAAINTQRPLAPARLKWRMLANRGYKVVVVNMWQWRTLDSGGLGRGSREGGQRDGSSNSSSSSAVSGAESSIEEYDGTVMSEKLMYLQARLQAALGPSGAAVLSAATRLTRPLPQQLVLGGEGRAVVQQSVLASTDRQSFERRQDSVLQQPE